MRSRRARLTILHSLALAAAPALASDPTLEEIVVTGTRSEMRLLDYAGAIARVEAAEIAGLGATHHSELMNRLPGVLIQRGSGQESLTSLRSPVLTGAGSCGAFLFLEDGIPLRPVGFCNVNELFEVNSEQAAAVEVIRGTGSALYGSNAVHGIVNVINPLPSQLPAVGLALEGGSDEYGRLKLALSGDTRAGEAGMVLHATHDGGWRDDAGFDEQKMAASLVRPTAEGLLTLRLNATNLRQDTAGFIIGEDSYRDESIAKSNPNPEAYRNARSLRFSTHYGFTRREDEHYDARLVLRSSRMDFLQHFLLGKPLEENGQDSVAALLSRSGPAGGGRLVTGLDFEHASGFLRQTQAGPTTGGSTAADAIRPAGKHYDYEVRSLLGAGYVHWVRPLGQRFELTAGLRLEWLQYDYDNRMLDGNTDQNGVPCGFGGCLYNRPADRKDEFANAGPRLALAWHPGAASAAWLGLSRGFRPPEATELYRLQRGQDVADLDSERIDGVELGYRRLGETLSVELTGFWMEKDDVILRDAFGFNVSGGRTRHQGVEYGFGWRPWGGLSLAASGAVARHTYRFTGAIEQGERVTSGDDVDTAPRQLHNVRLGYGGDTWRGELEWAYVDEYWANAANTARYPGHDLLNLRLSWSPLETLGLTLRVTNLTDRAYADRADFAFGNFRYFPGRGRAAFLEVSWRRD
jgi:outer membrane receptor protein involved in Fe transport